MANCGLVFLLLDGATVPLLLAAAAIPVHLIETGGVAAVRLLLLAEGLVGAWSKGQRCSSTRRTRYETHGN